MKPSPLTNSLEMTYDSSNPSEAATRLSFLLSLSMDSKSIRQSVVLPTCRMPVMTVISRVGIMAAS